MSSSFNRLFYVSSEILNVNAIKDQFIITPCCTVDIPFLETEVCLNSPFYLILALPLDMSFCWKGPPYIITVLNVFLILALLLQR